MSGGISLPTRKPKSAGWSRHVSAAALELVVADEEELPAHGGRSVVERRRGRALGERTEHGVAHGTCKPGKIDDGGRHLNHARGRATYATPLARFARTRRSRYDRA